MNKDIKELADIVFEEVQTDVFKLTKDRYEDNQNNTLVTVEFVRGVFKNSKNVAVKLLNGETYKNFKSQITDLKGVNHISQPSAMDNAMIRYYAMEHLKDIDKMVFKNASLILNKEIDNKLLELHLAITAHDNETAFKIKGDLSELQSKCEEIENHLMSMK